jgi:hypothetical protein
LDRALDARYSGIILDGMLPGRDGFDVVTEVRSRGPVGDRQLQHDLKLLMAVLHWATRVNHDEGRPLLGRNPLKGLTLPAEDSPPSVANTRRMANAPQQRKPLQGVE